MKLEMMGWQWHQLEHMQFICSADRSPCQHLITPLMPNQQCQSIEGSKLSPRVTSASAGLQDANPPYGLKQCCCPNPDCPTEPRHAIPNPHQALLGAAAWIQLVAAYMPEVMPPL